MKGRWVCDECGDLAEEGTAVYREMEVTQQFNYFYEGDDEGDTMLYQEDIDVPEAEPVDDMRCATCDSYVEWEEEG